MKYILLFVLLNTGICLMGLCEMIYDKFVKFKEERTRREMEKIKYGEFNNVMLTNEEYEKLCSKLGEIELDKYIEKLSYYLESVGRKYKSHYATILNWYRRDNEWKDTSAVPPKKRTAFNNFEQKSPDYSEIEKRAAQKLMSRLAEV